MTEREDAPIGQIVLGRYRIVHRLATGGMGIIYLARTEGAQGFVKPAVIKRILPDLVGHQKIVTMFAREARIMSRLSHPGIVGITDFAQEGDAYLMALEYVHGFHLGKWRRFLRAKGRQFPVEVAIQITVSLLDALHYAHTLLGSDGQPLHIVHRDIKPSNVLVDVDGRVKLADFGIARMRTDQTAVVDKSTFKGTFAYSAPELLQTGEPSPASDLYSCAVLLHEILTGKNEFASEDVTKTAWKVISHQPSLVHATRPDAPVGLSEVVAKGLAKSPADRYQTAEEFANELRRVRGASAEEASALLSGMSAHDFNDPEMASSLELPDLAALDRMWRDFAVPTRPPPVASDSPTNAITVQQLPSESPTKVAASKARRIALGIGAGIVTLGAVTAFAISRPAEPPPPPVLFVEGSVAAIGVETRPIGTADPKSPSTTVASAAPSTLPVSPDTLPSAESTPGTGAQGSPVPSAKVRPANLTRAFARQEPQIARCFAEHSGDVASKPDISVRFEVGVDGHVLSTQILPTQVAGTPLGRCLARVAQATDFGPQAKPLSFRIPISAREGH